LGHCRFGVYRVLPGDIRVVDQQRVDLRLTGTTASHHIDLAMQRGGKNMEGNLDLYAQEELEFSIEELPEGAALGCFFCASSASTASCPGSSAATASSASTIG
jgi:hypothetical protein